MAWALRAMMGLALAFTAGAAMAGCPGPCGGGGYSAGYGQDGYLTQDSYYEAPPSYDELSPSYGYARQHYAGGSAAAIQASYYGGYDQGYGPPPPCRCDTRGGYSESYSSGAGEVSVPYSFFYDNGGVGPIPSYDDYGGGGGGYVIAGGGGSSFASASSHVSVSVRARGGFHGGGHHGGGCGCK